MRPWLFLFLGVVNGISDEVLYRSFCSVFDFRDEIKSPAALNTARSQLLKLGVDLSGNVTALPDEVMGLLLMKAALADYLTGLNEAGEWRIVVSDANTGQLKRERAFSVMRFAVVECLLLLSIICILRLLLIKQPP